MARRARWMRLRDADLMQEFDGDFVRKWSKHFSPW